MKKKNNNRLIIIIVVIAMVLIFIGLIFLSAKKVEEVKASGDEESLSSFGGLGIAKNILYFLLPNDADEVNKEDMEFFIENCKEDPNCDLKASSLDSYEGIFEP